jgi:predicted lipoprotein with Yx(FWY)xxD motif
VRSNGDRQICYNGRPLYLSRRDTSPGDVQDHGQSGKWYAANIEPTVLQLTDADGNPYLAGPDGMTLYSINIVSDRPGIGECRRGCAENWPPLVIGRAPAAGMNDELGVVQRTPPDRRLQVTYEGQPLYYWSRDRLPGDTP